MMTMSFPCNDCAKPTPQSHHPDRWLCAECGRDPQEVAQEERSFAVEGPEPSDEEVYQALLQMSQDKRIKNQPVTRVFAKAAALIAACQGGAPVPPERKLMSLEEAQRKHTASIIEAGIDPGGMQGTMLRASFLAGFKVGRGS